MTFTLISEQSVVLEERSETVPAAFALDQNFPNPFNGQTVVSYSLTTAAQVDLTVFNLAGQEVATLAAGWRDAGVYSVLWDGQNRRGCDPCQRPVPLSAPCGYRFTDAHSVVDPLSLSGARRPEISRRKFPCPVS